MPVFTSYDHRFRSDREIKARKIEAVICDALPTEELSNSSILDIGAGTGHIAAHFAKNNAVTAADVKNQLCTGEAILNFVQLSDKNLPFEDASFDIVILNQVLTYIPDQLHELIEIRRVLKPEGLCYISLPNRLFPIEPNSKIPFIHYLPKRVYVKVLRRLISANEETCVLNYRGMIELFNSAGFVPHDYTAEVLSNPIRYHSGVRFRLPKWHCLALISPTNIFILKKNKVQR
jgi:ubiquinone/menaquinone biosynthesis C-methylase UbiE